MYTHTYSRSNANKLASGYVSLSWMVQDMDPSP